MKTETLPSVRITNAPLLLRAESYECPLLAGGKKMPMISIEPLVYSSQWPVFEVTLSKSGVSSNDPTIPNPSKDYLLSVRMLGDSRVALRFLDGVTGELDLADLGLNTSELRIGTIRASSWGGAAEVEDLKWHTIHIDSSVLRASIDPHYASILQDAIAAL